MEDMLTIENVRDAIQKLKNDGERVTRRNVIAITGGSMSTVHRMMGQIEDMEAKAAAVPLGGISEALSSAIREEIDQHIQKVSTALQEQIYLLQDREKQALDALTVSENRAGRLEKELEKQILKAGQEKADLEKRLAVAKENISHLERDLESCNDERTKSQKDAELARQDASKLQFQLDRAERSLDKLETKIDYLETELLKERKSLAKAEKDAAVSHQKALDLRDALEKAELALTTASQ